MGCIFLGRPVKCLPVIRPKSQAAARLVPRCPAVMLLPMVLVRLTARLRALSVVLLSPKQIPLKLIAVALPLFVRAAFLLTPLSELLVPLVHRIKAHRFVLTPLWELTIPLVARFLKALAVTQSPAKNIRVPVVLALESKGPALWGLLMLPVLQRPIAAMAQSELLLCPPIVTLIT